MKPIKKDELYANLNGFLKARGIELTDGAYSQGVKTSCAFLTDAINLGQEGFERARVEINKHLSQLRQVVHEATAPRSARTPPRQGPAAAQAGKRATGAGASKGAPRKAAKPGKTAKPRAQAKSRKATKPRASRR